MKTLSLESFFAGELGEKLGGGFPTRERLAERLATV